MRYAKKRKSSTSFAEVTRVTHILPKMARSPVKMTGSSEAPPLVGTEAIKAQATRLFGADGLLRRHDYEVEVAGRFPAAHYVSEYQNVSGFQMATKRRVFPRQPDNVPTRNVLTIAIDLSEIRFT